MEFTGLPSWTNASVRALAGDADPVTTVSEKARAIVMDAVQKGWKGPPYDPFELAAILGIEVVPSSEVPEARVVPRGTHLAIEFNPSRPRRRLRFSMAHELAHTLFPDCVRAVRNRGLHDAPGSDSWELENLCNIAASEFLMPAGEEIDPATPPTAEGVLAIQQKYDVSTEAAAIRLARVSVVPFTVAVASTGSEPGKANGYRIEYSFPSRASSLRLPRGASVKTELVDHCSGVGFTAKGTGRITAGAPEAYMECVGTHPYEGMSRPRVVFLILTAEAPSAPRSRLTHVRGDALKPRGKGRRIIAQIVNDATPTWGGGFSRSVRDALPDAQAQYRAWASRGKNLHLGRVHLAELKGGLFVASLVAQKGYKESPTPKIRYAALKECLDQLARAALERNAEIHMPRIGAGLAEGDWTYIQQLIDDCLVSRGINVTVYTLPGAPRGRSKVLGGGQKRLDAALPDSGERDMNETDRGEGIIP